MPTDFIRAPLSSSLSTGMLAKHARPKKQPFRKYLEKDGDGGLVDGCGVACGVRVFQKGGPYIKSLAIRWEPLAIDLNSTPSRFTSGGKHHSTMFPVSTMSTAMIRSSVRHEVKRSPSLPNVKGTHQTQETPTTVPSNTSQSHTDEQGS